jgi:GH43 family beta-xylosidase
MMIWRRRFTSLVVLAPLMTLTSGAKAQQNTASPTTNALPQANALPQRNGLSPSRATFYNPLKQDGADPWLTYYNGWYYLATTTAVDVKLRRARRLGELKDAPDQVIWKDDTPSRHRDIWAPELFLLDGGNGPRWYLYYTASDGQKDANHRMYVCESAGTDPMGPYSFKAQVQTDEKNEHYAIDGTILKLADGSLYFLWCGRPSPNGQGLYISRMANPWTTTGPRVYLPADGFGCNVVREGPEILQRNGQIFLIYSACAASTPDYKLGMLIADTKSDLLKPESWRQHPNTVFARVDQHGVYGPGHNFFFKSPDGTEDWIAYHAKSGTSDTYHDRSTRAQRFTWNADGTPNFGLPLSVETPIPVPSGEPRPEK